MKKSLRRWLYLAASALILLLILSNLRQSPEWRNFRWDQLWSTVLQARPAPLSLALMAMSLTYFLRAYRWRFFLEPIKRASLWNLFVGQILGFSSIYLVGRAGEFVRPAYIAKKENLPFTAMAAVWLLERVFDSAFLVLIFAASLALAHVAPTTARGGRLLVQMQGAGQVLLIMIVLMVGGLLLFRLRAAEWTARLSKACGSFLPDRGRHYVEHFLRSFASGLEVIRSWKHFFASVLTTAALWGMNSAVFWLIFHSLRGGLERLPWTAAVLVMICAGLGLIIQIPGVGGGYQVGAILALTQIFSIRAEAATGAGVLIWMLMSVPCMGLGVALLIHEGLTLRKLEELAEQEREAIEKA